MFTKSIFLNNIAKSARKILNPIFPSQLEFSSFQKVISMKSVLNNWRSGKKYVESGKTTLSGSFRSSFPSSAFYGLPIFNRPGVAGAVL